MKYIYLVHDDKGNITSTVQTNAVLTDDIAPDGGGILQVHHEHHDTANMLVDIKNKRLVAKQRGKDESV